MNKSLFLKDKRMYFKGGYNPVPIGEIRACDPVTLAVTAIAVTAIAGGVTAYGQYQQAKAQSKMYDYQAGLAQQEKTQTEEYAKEEQKLIKSVAESNIATIQDIAAEDSKQLARDVAVLTGQQKAAIGALGIGGGTTAQNILIDTFDKARLDQMAIRYNANLKSYQIKSGAEIDIWATGEQAKMGAWSKEAESRQYQYASKNALFAGRINVASTILNTASSIAMMGAQGGFGGGSGSKSTKPNFVTV